MSDKTPADYLANFPPLLQSALAILALELIDATEDDRNQAWAWAKANAELEQVPEAARRAMKGLQGVAGAVQAHAAQNRREKAQEAEEARAYPESLGLLDED